MDELEKDRSFPSAESFYRRAVAFIEESIRGNKPVTCSQSAEELWSRLNEPIPFEGRPLDSVLAQLEEQVLTHCIRLYHPRYMGHQVSAPLPVAVWMESLIGAMNQSAAVREMSPVGTIIETLVLKWFSSLAGFGAESGGTMTSGGTEATYTALLAARALACPRSWEEGVGSATFALVGGEYAHYSVERAAGQLGLGVRNFIRIPSVDYRMDPERLKEVLDRLHQAGKKVIAVTATAGSTPTGSFDDLEAIGKICREKELWFHVDGAHGASALFSSRRKGRMKGVDIADSLSWDPHKMMLMPLAAGMLLVREEEKLQQAFSQSAPYLFHGEGKKRLWDQGLRSFQCSRRNDALKVWVALQRYGSNGFGTLYDGLCDSAESLYGVLSERNDFQTLHPPESNILCFRYLGEKGCSDEKLDLLNRQLRLQFNAGGLGWITVARLNERLALRAVMMNPQTTIGDIQLVVEELARIGRSIRKRQ